jgi:hypothetical protein
MEITSTVQLLKKCAMICKVSLYFCCVQKDMSFFRQIKDTWDKNEYVIWCSRNKINGIAGIQAGICKLR